MNTAPNDVRDSASPSPRPASGSRARHGGSSDAIFGFIMLAGIVILVAKCSPSCSSSRQARKPEPGSPGYYQTQGVPPPSVQSQQELDRAAALMRMLAEAQRLEEQRQAQQQQERQFRQSQQPPRVQVVCPTCGGTGSNAPEPNPYPFRKSCRTCNGTGLIAPGANGRY